MRGTFFTGRSDPEIILHQSKYSSFNDQWWCMFLDTSTQTLFRGKEKSPEGKNLHLHPF